MIASVILAGQMEKADYPYCGQVFGQGTGSLA
jgi:hypothetical protein